MELEDLPGVGPTTAQKMKDAGISTVMAVAVTPVETLADATGLTEKAARKVTQAARESLDMGFIDATSLDEDAYYISTGSKAFDEMIDGGIKSGVITEIHGEYSSGKTQIVHQIVVNCLKQFPEGHVVYIDTENTFTKKRIKQMAKAIGFSDEEIEELFNRIKIAKAYNSDHQLLLADSMKQLVTQGYDIKLVIVDSLTAHFRSEYQGRGALAARQQKLGKHLSDLSVFADMYNVPVFITNQVSADPGSMFGDPISAIGGNIVGHASKIRIKVRRGKKHESGTLRVAKLIDHPHMPDNEVSYIITEAGLEDL